MGKVTTKPKYLTLTTPPKRKNQFCSDIYIFSFSDRISYFDSYWRVVEKIGQLIH